MGSSLSAAPTDVIQGGLKTELEAKTILRQWGLPVPACEVASSAEEAVRLAETLRFPVVLKVLSPAIVHKSDAGGVKLNLADAGAVRDAYAAIVAACGPLDPAFKVLVQPMLPPGLEVILGVQNGPQFGHVIMFGLGGVMVELFQDVTFRLLPIDGQEALSMLDSIQAAPLLRGYRGSRPVDRDVVVRLLVAMSDFVACHPEISELDLNPVLLYPDGAAIVDARMVVSPKA